MNAQPAASAPDRAFARWAPVAVAAAALLVYANTFAVPFLLDDQGSIQQNPTIRSLWGSLRPPAGGDTVSGRPLLNFSFALNHAISGLDVWSYHAVNLLIHAANGLLVLGLVRRTLERMVTPRAGGFALIAALLWTVHPLQTEAVTYIVQRAESLVACGYLFTLYAFVRSAEPAAPGWWRLLAVGACALGMTAKEVMVSAPLIVFLYDRTFLAGTFRVAWAARRGLHLALATCWLVLAALLLASADRGGTTVATAEATSWRYLLTQCQAIVRYLALALWPAGLVFDYGTGLVRSVADVWWQGLVLLSLLGATAWALVRRPVAGFLGTFFFAVLAPSSSFVPVLSQTMAEHRMYLPLLAVILLVLLAARRWGGERALFAAAVLVPVLAVATLRRNATYRDELQLWQDTAAKYPASDRAHNNLGAKYLQQGRLPEAAAAFEAALRIRPDYLRALSNLSLVLLQQGDTAGALARIAELLRLRPDDSEARIGYARMLERADRREEALAQWREAVRLRPGDAEVRAGLGGLLLRTDRPAEAAAELAEAARLRPDDPAIQSNLGSALALAGQPEAAVAAYLRSVALRPEAAPTRLGLALVLVQLGRPDDAVVQLREAVRIDPNLAAARSLLAQLTARNP
jgi:tetratricopeptide (TPR) repeat protein